MTEAFNTILRTYGRTVVLCHAGEKAEVRAFLQRVQKTETDAPEEDGPFGAADLRRWVYLGPRDCPVEAGDRVLTGDGEELTVQTAAAVYAGGERSHWWAVLRPAREALP